LVMPCLCLTHLMVWLSPVATRSAKLPYAIMHAVTFWMVLCFRSPTQLLLYSKNRSCNFTLGNVLEQLGSHPKPASNYCLGHIKLGIK
jgi:hypothetical protein